MDLTIHQLSEAIWKSTIVFFIMPFIIFMVINETHYEWYEYALIFVGTFILTWLSFLFHTMIVLFLVKENTIEEES